VSQAAGASAPVQSGQTSEQDMQTTQSMTQETQPAVQPDAAPAPQQIISQQWASGASGSLPTETSATAAPSPAFYSDDHPVVGGKPAGRRKFVIFGAALALVLVLAGGYVFGMYLPNKPENVYRTGLSRTGVAVDKLIDAGTEQSKIAAIKSSDVSGTIQVTGPDGKQTGTFSTKYDDKQSDSAFNYRPSATANNFNVQIMSDLADGQTYPSVYFKWTNLSVLGLDQMIPELAKYDGKWIGATSQYIESMIPAESQAAEKDKQAKFTEADAAQLARTVTDTTREYVLTGDSNKAVLVQKSFKGTEKLDGDVTANRYVVGIDKPHAKDYCAALITRVMAADAYKRVPGVSTDGIAKDRDAAIKDCKQSIDDDIKDSDTFEMWIDKSSKLIHKIRFAEKDDAGTYVELGQSYKSGDRIPLFVRFYSKADKYDAKLTLDVDTKQSVTTGSFTGTFTDGEDKDWTVKASMTFKPYSGDVKVTPPKDAVPLQDVLTLLGLDPAMLSTGSAESDATLFESGSTQTEAEDTERQIDIWALQGQLEAYYATNGWYPSLAQVNDASWRAANMKGLDAEALVVPGSMLKTLAASPSVTQYGYQAGGCSANKCRTYSLETIFSNGEKFIETSLNEDVSAA
jgi:hypothetical protein